MRDWLAAAVLDSSVNLPEEAEGYVLGRGLTYSLMEEMRVGVWNPPSDPAPDSTFRYRYGDTGGRLEGWLVFPVWAPRGRLVGVEFRRWDGEKEVNKHFLPDVSWSPAFMGLTPSALNRIWEGGDVWLVEGVFDLALAHIVPPGDAVLACGGAKITRSQLSFLQRFMGSNAVVHVAFDMDETGQKMVHGYQHPDTGRRVWGVVERLEKVGVRAQPVSYRGGKDPGEIWEIGGAASLRRSFAVGGLY